MENSILNEIFTNVSIIEVVTFVLSLASIITTVVIAIYQIKNSKTLKKLEFDNSKNLLRSSELSQKQKAIMEVMIKLYSNLYKDNSDSEQNNDFDYIIREALKDTDHYKDKENNIDKALNPMGFLLVELFSSTTSIEVINLILWLNIYMDKHGGDSIDQSKEKIFWSVLYKYVVLDYKNIDIGDYCLLKFNCPDYDESECMKVIKFLNDKVISPKDKINEKDLYAKWPTE